MNRRDFLNIAAAAGAGVFVPKVVGQATNELNKNQISNLLIVETFDGAQRLFPPPVIESEEYGTLQLDYLRIGKHPPDIVGLNKVFKVGKPIDGPIVYHVITPLHIRIIDSDQDGLIGGLKDKIIIHGVTGGMGVTMGWIGDLRRLRH